MFTMPTMIKMFEKATNALMPSGKSAAETDTQYYDTGALSDAENDQAMLALARQQAPEGSIFLVKSGEQTSFKILRDTKHEGVARGEAVATLLLEDSSLADEIEAIVIPGCASSPLGTAAFGKQVANSISGANGGKTVTVAAIHAGQGAFDQWTEALSGGTLMAPMAFALNLFDRPLESVAKLKNVGARIYMSELMASMDEAATLYPLLEGRLVGGKLPKMNMVVSHSKGNWSVLVALINVELELVKKIGSPKSVIDVVTFGNPVDLPDMDERMKDLFHYHQYVGQVDKLAHSTLSRVWGFHPCVSNGTMVDPHPDPKEDPKKEEFGPKAANNDFDPSVRPDERMFANTEHHLFDKIEAAKKRLTRARDELLRLETAGPGAPLLVAQRERVAALEKELETISRKTPPYHMPIEKILLHVIEAAKKR